MNNPEFKRLMQIGIIVRNVDEAVANYEKIGSYDKDNYRSRCCSSYYGRGNSGYDKRIKRQKQVGYHFILNRICRTGITGGNIHYFKEKAISQSAEGIAK